jgi:hypothetical protein
MKAIIRIIIIGSFIAFLNACKKDNSGSNNQIAGKWNIVKDSTYVGVGVANHLVVYVGQPGDYFDFRTNGNVYTKENVVFDTLSYTVKSDNQIVISKFGIIANGIPSVSKFSLTAHTASIITPRVLTPGGQFGRDVNLTR